MTNEIDPVIVRKILRYEPETGKLFWLARDMEIFANPRVGKAWNSRYAGREAITADNGVGYKIGSIFNRHYLAHRLAWVITHGDWPEIIDHINGDPGDNRIANLRSVSAGLNSQNTRRGKRNTSGRVGVSWHNASHKWWAQISLRGRHYNLGLYDTMEAAAAARAVAERELGFHPNHGRAA